MTPSESKTPTSQCLPSSMPYRRVAECWRLRTMYSHWANTVRKARLGVLLQLDTDYDGEHLNVNLPRAAPVAITARRGYLCSGGVHALVQTTYTHGCEEARVVAWLRDDSRGCRE